MPWEGRFVEQKNKRVETGFLSASVRLMQNMPVQNNIEHEGTHTHTHTHTHNFHSQVNTHTLIYR